MTRTSSISARNLLDRINRKIGKSGQSMRMSRAGTRQREELGQFFLADRARSAVLLTDLDLEAWARREGFLKTWETLHDQHPSPATR